MTKRAVSEIWAEVERHASKPGCSDPAWLVEQRRGFDKRWRIVGQFSAPSIDAAIERAALYLYFDSDAKQVVALLRARKILTVYQT